MIIFGVDPGTIATGYGIIRAKGNCLAWIDSGVIIPQHEVSLCEKLVYIYDSLVAKMEQHAPKRVCVEDAFYGKNVHTTLLLGHARGVALLAAKKLGAEVVEFSPREIKKSVVGNGNAAKEQVAYMVRMLIAPPLEHVHADAYDALAAALCGFYRGIRSERLSAAKSANDTAVPVSLRGHAKAMRRNKAAWPGIELALAEDARRRHRLRCQN